MPADHTEKQAAAQAAVDILHEMSTILVRTQRDAIYQFYRFIFIPLRVY